MLALKLASRNLIGAGLRTWLNVVVLSFAYVFIIWHKGLLDGWDRQAKTDMIAWETGHGQFWQERFDPYDPFSLQDSHAKIPDVLQQLVDNGRLTPILITQGTIYPGGRFQNVMLKGIDPQQRLLKIPTAKLDTFLSAIPTIIGKKMAQNNKLKVGDAVTLRWRDVNGTFDATEIVVVGVFGTDVPTIDKGNIWIPIIRLQEMMQAKGEATMLVHQELDEELTDVSGWKYKGLDVLMKDFDDMMKSKSVGGSIFYFILLLLALLAIFDTQVLSIFRRQKEIGTYVAMGMTRQQVVALFTTEGAMNAVLAAIVGAVYGIPFLGMQAVNGISMGGMEADDYGIAMSSSIFPIYSVGLIGVTIIIIMLTTTLVSYWPARKISKMKPTDALRGKLQ